MDSYARVVVFLKYMSKRRESIVTQLNTSHAAQIRRNTEVLKSIISTVELSGRQGIALRGHRDDGKHLEDLITILVTFKLCLSFDVMLLTLL